MRRFFLEPGSAPVDGIICVSGDLFRHMAKVLRLKVGTKVVLCGENGDEFCGEISSSDRESLLVRVTEHRAAQPIAAGLRITLYQGMPKGEKLELILQKCTELGVSAIVPFVAGRSVKKVGRDRETDLLARWRRIVTEAARQAGRKTVPELRFHQDFADMLQGAAEPVKLLLWEGEQVNRLKSLIAGMTQPEQVGVLIGPEGGFSREEAERAMAAGFVPVSLGDRILRTETAGLTVVALLQYCWGDLG